MVYYKTIKVMLLVLKFNIILCIINIYIYLINGQLINDRFI